MLTGVEVGFGVILVIGVVVIIKLMTDGL